MLKSPFLQSSEKRLYFGHTFEDMNVIALASGCGVAAKVTSELFGVDFALVLLEVSQAVD